MAPHPAATRFRRRPPAVAALALVAALVAPACSADDSDGATATTAAASTTTTVDLGAPAADQTAPEGTNGLAFDADGRLWIADLTGNQILAVDPADGSILVRLGADAGVHAPDDLAFDADGRLWWTNNEQGGIGRIDAPAAAGATSTTVAEVGPGANPIAVAPDGRIYVARALQADQLLRIDPDSGAATVVSDPAGQLNGFAFGPDGVLYAPRFIEDGGRVSAVDPETGTARDIVGGLPLTVAVAVAPDGTLAAITASPVTLHLIDREMGAMMHSLDLPGPVADNLAYDAAGHLWVSSFDQALVWRVDSMEGEPASVAIGA